MGNDGSSVSSVSSFIIDTKEDRGSRADLDEDSNIKGEEDVSKNFSRKNSRRRSKKLRRVSLKDYKDRIMSLVQTKRNTSSNVAEMFQQQKAYEMMESKVGYLKYKIGFTFFFLGARYGLKNRKA